MFQDGYFLMIQGHDGKKYHVGKYKTKENCKKAARRNGKLIYSDEYYFISWIEDGIVRKELCIL